MPCAANALPVHRRDGFPCRYCGLDGTESLASRLSLSSDHLLPKWHPDRNNPDYVVTACVFCNTADNRYFDLAERRGLTLDGLTPDELVAQRLPFVRATRQSYEDFWRLHVRRNSDEPNTASAIG
jgi:5-methylcytosine-specific restriction endonuclease McrA